MILWLGPHSRLAARCRHVAHKSLFRHCGFVKVAGPNTKVLLGVKDFGGEAVNTAVSRTEFTDVSVSFTTGATQTSAVVYFYKLDGGEVFGDDFYLRKQ